MTWLHRASLITALACAVLLHPPPAGAVDNAAIGGIGGVDNGTLSGGDGTGTARISLFAVDLTLVKQARDLAGAVLPDGADVAPGEEIYFVLLVDNPTVAAITDLQLEDLLDESQFTYVPSSLESTLVPSGSNDAAVWAGAWSPLTDLLGAPDDAGSVTDTGGPPSADRLTIGAAPGQANQTIDIPAMSLRAIRFRATVN